MHIPCRFLRHVPVIYVDYPAAASLRQIYGTFNRAMLRLVPNLRTYADPLTEAMVEFYTMSQVSMTLIFNGGTSCTASRLIIACMHVYVRTIIAEVSVSLPVARLQLS